MGTLIQDNEQRNPESQTRWERCERADRFEPYQALRTQGVSQRQAATELKVPRTALQAWPVYQDDLDEHPAVRDSPSPLSCRPHDCGAFPDHTVG